MFKKRRRKIVIAVVDEIEKNLGNPIVGDPDFLLGVFGCVCLRSSFIPTERDARRIFELIKKEMIQRQQIEADTLDATGNRLSRLL